MRKFLSVLPFVLILGACTHGNCRAQKKDSAENTAAAAAAAPGMAAAGAGTTSASTAKTEKTAPAEVAVSSKTERVKVYKADGSLQCGQGKAIPVADMQKELKNIKVYSAVNKNDGMMRIQVCGAPTGNSNVYEIDRKDLSAAVKAGFKEWTFE